VLHTGELALLLLALGLLLAVARACGELADRLGQPAVLGELLAGVLLGPTLLGAITPEGAAALFPPEGPRSAALSVLTQVAIVLFLTVAGMDVDLPRLLSRWRIASTVSLAGIAVPFALGMAAGTLAPAAFGYESGGASPAVFALFLGTALAISALPVIARTLVDLNLHRTDLGMLVVGAAVVNDLAGWILFGLAVGSFRGAGGADGSIAGILVRVLGFAALVLSLGRLAARHGLAWLARWTRPPAGPVPFVVAFGFLAAGLTEWLGVGAMLGAFLAGVAMGGALQSGPRTLVALERLVSTVFAPLFFASIGLRTNFVHNFDGPLVLALIAIACVGKVLGCAGAARWSGMPRREAWAVGFGMNARGAMEIALALLALQYGLIGERLFVALVVMALVTSAIAGPVMRRLLARRRGPRFVEWMAPETFRPGLAAEDRSEAIWALAGAASLVAHVERDALARAVLARERIMPTGVGYGVAIPHARLPGLARAVIALGVIPAGVDFGAPDGEPARIVALVVTPEQDDGLQLEILADLARALSDEATRERVLAASSWAALLEALRPRPSAGATPSPAAASSTAPGPGPRSDAPARS
jgi:Kef-type K+ transport system membrane component KefB/mannitol/fructose-specific phosphotransferase system IIA component (Ntr-type)